ncbi:hypothetical protein Hanom_Chr13g01244421 [Helianthus anomalus]
MPLYRKATDPLILLPILQTFVKINGPHHLRYPHKLSACINLQHFIKNIINKLKEQDIKYSIITDKYTEKKRKIGHASDFC